ncbi:nickel-responsive transcriptional regulator NikR [Neptunomonas phycophila]|jgi:CopG family nickel-responsive transcriptional regulator|uniref:Putative nickel-responsive regulator n=1 Tax=Neptunomonas phycophila TaxID=1572645 RepID=A0AAW7XIJ5_9GAMM|nr:nickel-responsive transcriptional regulator NikR [Neptunomonas phycophila]MDO6453447.1 nickel-responsive transcriptional regulator NikR [Neptunomonas phycophila]MDO6784854.1 nickel-responsive transcriptional regulator NikR [Neptunomonas phycophila]MDP2522411.1 nickel-responsive transcriptional regulator NikR [Neptunomonas phycophila]QLE99044.1 nickel-responsive transcriptional regulator NikR [Neptunomonas phycophila]
MSKEKLSRISISLPESLLDGLDQMVNERGFESRSQAICDMINLQLNDHRAKQGHEVMTGTVNLVYNHSTPGLQKKLHDLQFEFIDEVISSLNVNLTHTNTLSIILVQGPADKLNMIADKMITLRGVVYGRLLINSYIIPPIHPLPPSKGD